MSTGISESFRIFHLSIFRLLRLRERPARAKITQKEIFLDLALWLRQYETGLLGYSRMKHEKETVKSMRCWDRWRFQPRLWLECFEKQSQQAAFLEERAFLSSRIRIRPHEPRRPLRLARRRFLRLVGRFCLLLERQAAKVVGRKWRISLFC